MSAQLTTAEIAIRNERVMREEEKKYERNR